jgi:hypothetical protein
VFSVDFPFPSILDFCLLFQGFLMENMDFISDRNPPGGSDNLDLGEEVDVVGSWSDAEDCDLLEAAKWAENEDEDLTDIPPPIKRKSHVLDDHHDSRSSGESHPKGHDTRSSDEESVAGSDVGSIDGDDGSFLLRVREETVQNIVSESPEAMTLIEVTPDYFFLRFDSIESVDTFLDKYSQTTGEKFQRVFGPKKFGNRGECDHGCRASVCISLYTKQNGLRHISFRFGSGKAKTPHAACQQLGQGTQHSSSHLSRHRIPAHQENSQDGLCERSRSWCEEERRLCSESPT